MKAGAGKMSRQEMLHNIQIAAITEFSLHGFNGASTQSIAERVGIAKSQLHYYIEDKEQLYTGILEKIILRWAELLSFDGDGQDPVVVLSNYIQKKLDFALYEPELSRIFTHELISGGHRVKPFLERAGLRNEETFRQIQAWIDAGKLRPIKPKLLLMNIWGMTQYYADYSLEAEHMLGQSLRSPGQREEILGDLVEFVLRGCGLLS